MSRHPLLLALAFGLAAMAPAQALDLIEAWQGAAAHDPTLAAGNADARADATLAKQGRALLLPKIGLTAGAGAGSVTQSMQQARFAMPGLSSNQVDFTSQVNDGSREHWGVELRQPLYDAAASAGADQLKHQAAAGAEQGTAVRQQAMLRLAQRYFDVLALEADRRALAAQARTVEETRGMAETRYEQGDAPVTEREEARARLEMITAETLALEQQLTLARQRLADLTGLSANAPLVAGEHDPGANELAVAPLDYWLQAGRAHNPMLKAAEEARSASAREVDKYRAVASPKVELVAQSGEDRWQHGGAGQLGRQQYLGIELTVPLFTGGYRNAKLEEALARSEAAGDRLEANRLGLDDQVRSAWYGLQQGKARLAALAAAAGAVDKQLDATRIGVQEGDRTTLDLLNAEQAQADVARQRAATRTQVLYAWLALKAAAGELSEADLLAVDRLLQQAR